MFNKQQLLTRFIDDSRAVEALSTIMADLEISLLREVKALQDAVDVDHIGDVPEREDRERALQELVEAQIAGDLESFWLEEVAADRIENHEDAAPYLGLTSEEWEQQVSRWAEVYRAQGAGEDVDDEELAREHVRRQFGIGLKEFRREVIEWDAGDAMRSILAGNLRAGIQGVQVVREELESGDDA